MKRYDFITRLGGAALLAFATFMCANMTAAAAPPLRIVAIGASNTHGWYVGNEGAYPAKLQALLRAKGIDAQVTNAGVPFETTGLMLRRIDKDVPDGTDIVILQPGGNDQRFLVPPQWRAANIAEMERRLQARSIQVIVYDEFIPLHYRTLDFIHLTQEGHARRGDAVAMRGTAGEAAPRVAVWITPPPDLRSARSARMPPWRPRGSRRGGPVRPRRRAAPFIRPKRDGRHRCPLCLRVQPIPAYG